MTTSDRAGWIALGLVAAAAVVVGLLVQSGAIATGTGSSDEGVTTYLDFTDDVERGVGCAELLDVRNRIPPNTSDVALASDTLRRLGCTSPDATRVAGGAPTFPVDGYRFAYKRCADDWHTIYRESGTDSAVAAAEWYSLGSSAGPSRLAAYTGCLDSLRGSPSQYP